MRSSLWLTAVFLLSLLITACSRAPSEPDLPVDDYLRSSASFEGHTYRLAATVERQAGADANGLLLVVAPKNNGPRLPLYVPRSLQLTLLPEQRMFFTLRIRDGILHVTAAQKQ